MSPVAVAGLFALGTCIPFVIVWVFETWIGVHARGTVYAIPTGLPIADVEVVLVDEAGMATARTWTDSMGIFRISGDGERLEFRHPAWWDNRRPVEAGWTYRLPVGLLPADAPRPG
jgi:hypothetical protein